MRALAANDLLQVWEWGEDRHPIDRALLLLAVALPERTWEELASLSIGQRDALLLTLRELTFGPRLDCFVACPQCGTRLEFTFETTELRTADDGEPKETRLKFAMDALEVVYRLPNSLDLAAIASRDDAGTARDLLARRCILQAREGKIEVAAEALPEQAITMLAAQMAEHDPLSEVQLDLHCPECSQGWFVSLDIASFMWTEISARAKRLLLEVHALARAYGWREQDILAMSTRRRQSYLEMVT